MVKVTTPYICEISEEKKELEKLLFNFGKARRRVGGKCPVTVTRGCVLRW